MLVFSILVRVGLDLTNLIANGKMWQVLGIFYLCQWLERKQLVILQSCRNCSKSSHACLLGDYPNCFYVVLFFGVVPLFVLINFHGFLTCWPKVRWL